MTCRAAKRCALVALGRGPRTSEQVFRLINWWTHATVVEALAELCAERRAQITSVGGRLHYCLPGDG